jgi:hypothetical protein
VLELGKRYTSNRGSWIQITDRSGGRMSFERHYARRTGKADPGTPHRDPYLPGAGELRVKGTFDPDTDFIEGYAEAWAHHMRQDTVNDQDEMPLTQILVIARATAGQSYTSRLPRGLQKATLPLIAAIGRLRGYKPSYD